MFTFEAFKTLFFILLQQNNGDVQKTVVDIYNKHNPKGKRMSSFELFSNLPSELSVGPITQFNSNAWEIIMQKLLELCPSDWLPYIESAQTREGKVLYYLTDLYQRYQNQMNWYNHQMQQYTMYVNYIQNIVLANPHLPPNQLPLPPQPQPPPFVRYSFDMNNISNLDRWFCMSSYLSILPMLQGDKKPTNSYNP